MDEWLAIFIRTISASSRSSIIILGVIVIYLKCRGVSHLWLVRKEDQMNQETRGGPVFSLFHVSSGAKHLRITCWYLYIHRCTAPNRRWSLLSVWQLKLQKWCELLIDYAALALFKELQVPMYISREGDMPWSGLVSAIAGYFQSDQEVSKKSYLCRVQLSLR